MAEPGGARWPAGQGTVLAINGLPGRGRVVCRGNIESVTYAPSGGVAAFTAIVSDRDTFHRPDHQRLKVIWLGRRRIPGLVPGTAIKLEGMLTQSQGKATMFNPRYEILSNQEPE